MKIVDEKFNLLQRFISWREKHITDKQFILVLSLLVGLFTALAAYVLKFLVEYIKEFLTPYKAAEHGYVDCVIDPKETRPRIINALAMLYSKREDRPQKKHGNIPL